MKLDVSSLAHTKWECKYHIVFAPKYRRQIIYGKIKQDIGQMLRKLCEYKGMVEHNVKGKLVLVSSNSAFLPQPVFGGYAHYTASKGGVISMTTEIAKEMKRYGIMVNTVAPDGMWTPGCLSNGPVSSLTPEKQAEIGREIMVAKLDYTPEADSVAVVVYALCTRLADGVTGECVVADSGMMRNIVSYQPAIEQFPAE